MPLTETLVEETVDVRRYRQTHPELGFSGERVELVAGGPSHNREQILLKAAQARAALRANYANWGTLTNAQKDAANRLAQRVVANLLAVLLEQFGDAGD